MKGEIFMNPNNMNILVLAYLGDSVYEHYIRTYLIQQNIANVNDLQTASLRYVSAKSQAKIIQELINRNQLTEEEQAIYRRARNAKNNHHPKNCDIVTYKQATGLEGIIGYLEILGKTARLQEILKTIVGEIVC